MSRLLCGHDESALYQDEAGGVSCRLCDESIASEPAERNDCLDMRVELPEFFPPVTTEWRLRQRYSDLADLACEKNRSYGDSATHPIRIMSDLPASAGIRVRIDDKLSRLKNQPGAFGEDTIKDLIGYLVLLTLAEEDES